VNEAISIHLSAHPWQQEYKCLHPMDMDGSLLSTSSHFSSLHLTSSHFRSSCIHLIGYCYYRLATLSL